jgi:hypothetical protein
LDTLSILLNQQLKLLIVMGFFLTRRLDTPA